MVIRYDKRSKILLSYPEFLSIDKLLAYQFWLGEKESGTKSV